jgi:hypothetical protein
LLRDLALNSRGTPDSTPKFALIDALDMLAKWRVSVGSRPKVDVNTAGLHWWVVPFVPLLAVRDVLRGRPKRAWLVLNTTPRPRALQWWGGRRVAIRCEEIRDRYDLSSLTVDVRDNGPKLKVTSAWRVPSKDSRTPDPRAQERVEGSVLLKLDVARLQKQALRLARVTGVRVSIAAHKSPGPAQVDFTLRGS